MTDILTELRDAEREMDSLQAGIVDREELDGKWPRTSELIEIGELQDRIIKLKQQIEENQHEH